ncbi:ORF54 [Ovine gammaherpesvirus 2]|uniref:Deoxyuridine triphosphatase-like protein n=1 Tax=Ovine gammaherpesvirus 2 TaxID=10398 RepID=Q2VSI6_9GAMA|nr:ORF54 [Ovine gammaherpesvirus 2]AAX58090.1 ORF54 [Ovine gammaherpesvirus 2]ABB22273.1 deoxyuridine triphosphatase-like protein [Ovine gammaherpesvirus 2]WOZ69499.1 ORF54 deoxyuridine triphosphatase [Ovine gammaherpesvirus 2]
MALTRSLRRHQRLEVYYKKEESRFKVTSDQEESKLQLVNTKLVTVRPFEATVLPLGVYVRAVPGYAILLLAKGSRNVNFHTGLIDPSYCGELKLICNNLTSSHQGIAAGSLKVTIVSFTYATPILVQPSILQPPRYHDDVGYDLHLDRIIVVLPLRAFTLKVSAACPVASRNFVPIVLGRSGLASRGLTVRPLVWRNSTLKLTLFNHTSETMLLQANSRICQVVFIHSQNLPTPSFLSRLCCAEKIWDIPFRQSRVSFIDIKKDLCTSSSTLNQESVCNNRVRGTKGLGSSGT